MTIRIINKCQNTCLHCMSESSPTRTEIMSYDAFKKSLRFIDLTVTNMINITGGEAILHPLIFDFLEEACQSDKIINLLSNGLFLRDNIELRNKFFLLMSKYKNLRLQVTSVKGLYNNFIHKNEIEPTLKQIPIYKYINERIIFVHTLEYGVIPVGRAKQYKEQINKVSYMAMDRTVPKCFNLYNIVLNLGSKVSVNILDVINYLKLNSSTSLCVPLIKENGDVVFGEFESCNIAWNIHNESYVLNVAELMGACGSCYANETQVNNVNKYLSGFTNRHNKIKESVLFRDSI